MYRHIFINNLKIYIREKNIVFWLLFFPIILATFFKLAFGGLLSGESFEIINIGVIEDQGFEEDSLYTETFQHMSEVFNISLLSVNEAEKELSDGKISAYLYGDDYQNGTYNKISIVIKENGIGQTILKSVVDRINETSLKSNLDFYKDQKDLMYNIERLNVENYLENQSLSGKPQNTIVVFFYTVLGMAALYGSVLGIFIIENIQANLSSKGIRFNVAPVSKLKGFIGMYTAAGLLQGILLSIVYLYISRVLGIDFGERYGFILLTTIVGGFTGISIGAFIGVVTSKSQEFKIGISIGFSMICSYLAGMMDSSMKYKIEQYAPIVSKLNPSALITDAFLKLYYYDDLKVYYENIFMLILIIIVMGSSSVFILRRQRYDSV